MESHEMHLLIAAGAYPPLCSSAMRARPLLLLLSLTAACESTRQAFPDSDTTTTTGGSSVHGTTTGDPGGTGDDTTGSETTGDDTTGGDSTGESATGDDTTTGDTTGDETTGEDSTGDDSTGGSTTGGDATGGTGLEPLAPQSCTQRFFWDAFGEAVDGVFVAGEFNGWSTTAHAMSDPDGDGTWEVDVDTAAITPGSYGYKLVKVAPGGAQEWILDNATPMRRHVDGTENSKVVISDCQVPSLELESLNVTADAISVVVAVRDGAGNPGLDPLTAKVRHQFSELTDSGYDAASRRFSVTLPSPTPGKHTLMFSVANGAGVSAPLFLPIWSADQVDWEWKDATLYFAMTDRFNDGDPGTGAPDACLPADSKANWLGGDWKGVTQKIESGYFDQLGVSAIWLTAPIDNPEGCLPGQLGKQYTSYHGYFPTSLYDVESRLGTMADLQNLVAAAHSRGIRVLVDLVANHLHDSNPVVSEHPDWFHGYFQCGFEEAPLSCWFEAYLPDIDYAKDGIVDEMTQAALWWAREADLDGFRVDAVKHMHDNFLRTLRPTVERELETVPGSLFWMVGETFTGDWGGGEGPNESVIKKYIKPYMLHGQFDFPLYWRVVQVFARNEFPASFVTNLLEEAGGYYGSQAIMSNFLGNHDVPRFISHAAGHIGDVWGNGSKEQGWDNPPSAPDWDEPYQRLRLAWSFLMTIPGVPLIYYGDEIGMPGAGDPDNRRKMTFSGWSGREQGVFDHLATLGTLRRDTAALRRGDYQTLFTDQDVVAYGRATVGSQAIVVLNRSGAERTLTVAAQDGAWKDALAGGTQDASSGTLNLTVGPWGTRVLTR